MECHLHENETNTALLAVIISYIIISSTIYYKRIIWLNATAVIYGQHCMSIIGLMCCKIMTNGHVLVTIIPVKS